MLRWPASTTTPSLWGEHMTEPDFRVDGKIAIVTGAATGGIGETYAAALAGAGASVVCADIDGARAEAAAKGIDGAIAVTVDITDPGSVAAMVAATLDAFGGVDILVNNAAISRLLKLEATSPTCSTQCGG